MNIFGRVTRKNKTQLPTMIPAPARKVVLMSYRLKEIWKIMTITRRSRLLLNAKIVRAKTIIDAPMQNDIGRKITILAARIEAAILRREGSITTSMYISSTYVFSSRKAHQRGIREDYLTCPEYVRIDIAQNP